MTNDADYELWAAMMDVDEPTSPVAPVVISEPVIESTPVFEEENNGVVEEALGLSDLAKSTIGEIPSRNAEFFPSGEEQSSDEELDFPTNLFKEPQTNSITVQEVPDALSSDIVTESGEVLKTGAIDIPLLSNTGSIPIITTVPETIDEEAIKADMGDETTGGIPPIRARSVMNSSARVGVLPIRNRRSEGQTILLATTSILLVTLGAGVLALYMLEIIK